jgi:hypothetical protein
MGCFSVLSRVDEEPQYALMFFVYARQSSMPPLVDRKYLPPQQQQQSKAPA